MGRGSGFGGAGGRGRGRGRVEELVGREERRFRYARYVPGISRNIRAARILDMPTCV